MVRKLIFHTSLVGLLCFVEEPRFLNTGISAAVLLTVVNRVTTGRVCMKKVGRVCMKKWYKSLRN